jgi:hypothetical protein
MKRTPAFVLAGLLVLVAALPAAAQEGHWLGVKAGYGWPSPSVSTDLQILKGTDDSGGFVGGLSWEGGLWKGWSLEGEVLYVQRKATNTYFGGTSDTGGYQGDVMAEYTFTTLEIPFHARYRLSQGATAVFLLGGFVTAIPLDIESENRANGQSATEDAKNQFEKAWFALEVGAGIDHKLGNGVGLQLDVRYVYGLTDTAAVGGDSWKWRDVRVLAGLKFDL